MQVPYWGFISKLMRQENLHGPVVLLDMPHVAMRLHPRSLDMDDVAHALAEILAKHRWPTSCVIAHSFGTFIASRLCQLHPSQVNALVSLSHIC